MSRYRSDFDYYAYIRSPEWRAKADDAKMRAGWRCQLCYGAGPLEAHHRTYERLGNELPSDITVLCEACHAKFHDKTGSDPHEIDLKTISDREEEIPSSITMYTVYGSYTVDTSAKPSTPSLNDASMPVLVRAHVRDYSWVAEPFWFIVLVCLIVWIYAQMDRRLYPDAWSSRSGTPTVTQSEGE